MRHYNDIYRGRRVFVTGHTGFKGSWMVKWLRMLGAEVVGYSKPIDTEPNHFGLMNIQDESVIGDICDFYHVKDAMQRFSPEIVFHMAAQPLVRKSYSDPIGTYTTNVLGTLNVLESARSSPSVKAVVAVTTDKVYRNNEWVWGYRETDALGGYDPYSSSKACAEILIDSYRNSYWNSHKYGKDHNVLLASVRAGNVIGGGDWAQDRLIPDIVRAAGAGKTVTIRSPHSVRPWQHVLECLSGYLLVGQKLLEENLSCITAYNFGPSEDDALSVAQIMNIAESLWSKVKCEIQNSDKNPHEAGLLMLSSARAKRELGWTPVWNAAKAFERTFSWYRDFYSTGAINTEADIETFLADAHSAGKVWAL